MTKAQREVLEALAERKWLDEDEMSVAVRSALVRAGFADDGWTDGRMDYVRITPAGRKALEEAS